MKCLDFIASIIDSTSWPILLLIIIIIFRKKLQSLVSIIIKTKNAKYEMNFGSVVTIDETVKGDNGKKKEKKEKKEKKDSFFFKRLAEISPESAILLAWNEFEKVSNPVVNGRITYNKIFEEFKDKDYINDKQAKSLTQSRNFRNNIIHHEVDVSNEEVAESAFSVYEISCEIDSKISQEVIKRS